MFSFPITTVVIISIIVLYMYEEYRVKHGKTSSEAVNLPARIEEKEFRNMTVQEQVRQAWAEKYPDVKAVPGEKTHDVMEVNTGENGESEEWHAVYARRPDGTIDRQKAKEYLRKRLQDLGKPIPPHLQPGGTNKYTPSPGYKKFKWEEMIAEE
ncbi:hypothetical protein [Sicyoidochytrium minutum DNA virus]|nr:hypothetical protein [Sicyoidochytrium minutum DNA virus]